MPSATVASLSLSGASETITPASPAANASGSKPSQPRITSSTRKQQAESHMEASQRKTAKPWTRDSPNPLTDRTSATSNGVQAPNKTSSSPRTTPAPAKETYSPEKHANDRLMFLFANFVGLPSTITVKNGDRFTGIFSTATLDSAKNRYVLKMVKKLASPQNNHVNGVTDTPEDYIGTGPDHIMTFDAQDVVDLSVNNARLDQTSSKVSNGVTSGFRTDTDISGNVTGRERELQKWEPSTETAVDLSLDDGGQGWDQFETNARLYGVQSDYDESFYTTTIDKTNPRYKQIEAEAERIVREIEGSTAMNAHVAEERGQKPLDDSGLDEEMKYSGVNRNADFPPLPTGQPNKYTPPARRPPTGQPTVAGAPVDPAIISASIARPEAKKALNKEELSGEKAPGKENESVTPKAEGMTKQEPTSTVTAATTATTATTTAKPTTEQSTASVAAKAQQTSAVPTPIKASNKEGGATATIEKDVVDAFKSFAGNEKMRIQEHQRKMARQDKAVKLNDLKKFAENFKLHTPVPQDLVPILAKDKDKQDEIIQKALQNVQDLKSTPPKQPAGTAAPATDAKAAKPTTARPESGVASSLAPQDRQNQQRSRPNQPNFSQSVRGERPYQNQLPHMQPRQGPGNLSQRLNITQQQHRAGMAAMANIQQPMPIDPRMPPTGPAALASGVQSPTGASRFNVKAMEFRPNPAASSFLPSSNTSTGSSPVREPSSRPTEPKSPRRGNFHEGTPPVAENKRGDFLNAFNPIARMKKEAEADSKTKETFMFNGGIPPAYRTPPTWEVPKENQDKTYDQMFEKPPTVIPSVSPQHPSIVQPPPMAHQHQLPMHLQQSVPIPTPQHTPRHMPVQPHHGGPGGLHHMDDHRMQFTASTSSVQPSPRPMPPYIAYSGQGPQPMQIFQPAVPTYSVSPGGHPMAMRQVSGGPPAFITPQGQAMGGHMMANQPSSGPYVNVQMAPQMQMYSPVPGQVYPQPGGPMPPQPGINGYPSPRPPAPMMAHQGSQQGHPPQQMIYMQPGHGPAMLAQPPTGPMTPLRGAYGQPAPQHFSPAPHPHYQQQPHRGTPSASYIQPMMPAHSIPPQGIPPAAGPMAGDGPDDVK